MSVHAYAWAWQQPVEPEDKIVLLALCEFADATGLCWPSHARIARMTGRHRATIVRAIDRLVADGHVLRVSGRGKTNTYRLTLAEPRYPAEQTGDPAQHRTSREAREAALPLSTPVARCDTHLSHDATPTCRTMRHHLSHDATPPVAQLCDTNRKGTDQEPPAPLGPVDIDPDAPVDTRIPEPDRQRGLARIAELRAQLEARSMEITHALEAEGIDQPPMLRVVH